MDISPAKRWLKRHLPFALLNAYRNLRLTLDDRRNARRSPEEVFSEIYRKGTWGTERPFCSGSGTIEGSVIDPYIGVIGTQLMAMGNPVVVDLGCGDFVVGGRLLQSCSRYIGVDVVPALIAHLRATVSSPKATFLHLDIVNDELPDGDVCLIRQVFQHLSNAQISKVLGKLKRYKTVFVTEHGPVTAAIPNRDKVHGSGVRLYQHSGVYLDKAPFNIPIHLILEVPSDLGEFRGVIRTWRFSIYHRDTGLL